MAKGKSKLREYVEAILIALFLALLIRAFVIQAFKIPSGSMLPTLNIGDHLLVNKFIYGVRLPSTDERFFIIRQPKRGDIIVFSFPKNGEECKSLLKNLAYRFKNSWDNKDPSYLFKDYCRDFIKRVIGIGGDKIEIRNRIVYVNDTPLAEPYVVHSGRITAHGTEGPGDTLHPITVPRGKFFVMGDNREESYDSRFWGFVDMRDIKGKSLIIYWSWDKKGEWWEKVRWKRIGKFVE